MTDKTMEVDVQEAEVAEATEPTRSQQAYIPAASIFEAENQFTILADMPGVDEKSVEITLEKNELTINGAIKPFTPEGFTLAYREYGTGDYRRSFFLSDEVDRDHINASVKDGVLRLSLTKATDFKVKKIAVKAG